MLYYVFQTDLGYAGIAGRDGVIARFALPKPTRDGVPADLGSDLLRDARETDADFSGQVEMIRAYLAGERVDFDCALDYGGAGEFDALVWDAARQVGYGETSTYGVLADRIGRPKAPRAVGQALGRNPIPVIVPCHRILRSDNGLGGFSAGLHWKVKMLDMEGSRPAVRD